MALSTGSPNFTEKIDVLDMLIEILRDHEEKLDELTERLGIITDILETFPYKGG